MTGIVLVSHSTALARAALELVRALVPDLDVRLELASGTDDGGLGTDALAVLAAIERADDGSGVLVLADLGSAVMSAHTALELLDAQAAQRVILSPAPFVEGLVGAYAAAGLGRDLSEVASAAAEAVHAKQDQIHG